MNREDLIAMARNAGFPAADYPSLVSDKEWEALERFFQAAYAAGRKSWVGLTDEEVKAIFDSVPTASCQSYEHWRSLVAHAIEAKLKEKNT